MGDWYMARGDRVLVTGGAGYIGSHTCKALRQAGFAPVVYDNISRGNVEAVKWGKLVVGDLADGVLLRETILRHRPRAVVHFAALAYVGESNENPAAYYRNNVGGTAQLLTTMHECDIRHIVFSNSCAVYSACRAPPRSSSIMLSTWSTRLAERDNLRAHVAELYRRLHTDLHGAATSTRLAPTLRVTSANAMSPRPMSFPFSWMRRRRC
jgi:nucleoside-diphosphate-sugar epimerase